MDGTFDRVAMPLALECKLASKSLTSDAAISRHTFMRTLELIPGDHAKQLGLQWYGPTSGYRGCSSKM